MRKTTVTYSFRINSSVPMIRLRGKWLEVAGFHEDTPVAVDVVAGKLTLTVDETGITPNPGGESVRHS